MLGIYIHIPFCIKKCPYCNFYSTSICKYDVNRYINAILNHINIYKKTDSRVNTLYFGGGTPSLLNTKHIEKLILAVETNFKLHNQSEITIEINPNTLNRNKLLNLKDMGINRLSFGVQSFNDNELNMLGRTHTAAEAFNIIELAKNLGFENISIDIMIGIPGQTIESLNNTLSIIERLNIQHLSLYQLKIEKGTPFYNNTPNSIADDDVVSYFYIVACKKLEGMGLKQYEISNFAKRGKQSKHNLKYWTLQDYLGFGPSAHSFFKGTRFYNIPNLDIYMSNPTKTIKEPTDINFEWFILSLRLNSGISIYELKCRNFWTKNFEFKIKKLEKEKIIVVKNNKISLTLKGMLLQNSVILYLYNS